MKCILIESEQQKVVPMSDIPEGHLCHVAGNPGFVCLRTETGAVVFGSGSVFHAHADWFNSDYVDLGPVRITIK